MRKPSDQPAWLTEKPFEKFNRFSAPYQHQLSLDTSLFRGGTLGASARGTDHIRDTGGHWRSLLVFRLPVSPPVVASLGSVQRATMASANSAYRLRRLRPSIVPVFLKLLRRWFSRNTESVAERLDYSCHAVMCTTQCTIRFF